MSRIITGDESWESGCDPETEEQFSVEEPTLSQPEGSASSPE